METYGHGFSLWRWWDKIRDGLVRPAGHGKHSNGKQKPKNYRLKLKAARKRERQHRRRVQMQARGHKHRMKGV